jgi:hypothetical protein
VAVVPPGGQVSADWQGGARNSSDKIFLCSGPRGDLACSIQVISRGSGEGDGGGSGGGGGGGCKFVAPRERGLMSVVYAVSYSHVFIPAAVAHLCISDRACQGGGEAVGDDAAVGFPVIPPECGAADMRCEGRGGTLTSEGFKDAHGRVLAEGGGAVDEGGTDHVQAAGPRGGGGILGVVNDLIEGRSAEQGEGFGEGMGAGRREGREGLCLVCLDEEVTVLLRPCNHVILCAACAESVSLCPMDRRRITGRERVFLC